MSDKITLLSLLQLAPDASDDQVKEIYEQKLFEAHQDLLQKFAVPSLLRKKIKLLAPFAELENVTIENTVEVPFGSSAMTDRVDFLERYEQKMSDFRLAISSAKDFTSLIRAAGSLALQQDYYMVLFTVFFSEHYSALPEEVNTRDMIDTGRLLLQLKAGNPDDKMAWEIEKELARINKIHQLL